MGNVFEIDRVVVLAGTVETRRTSRMVRPAKKQIAFLSGETIGKSLMLRGILVRLRARGVRVSHPELQEDASVCRISPSGAVRRLQV